MGKSWIGGVNLCKLGTHGQTVFCNKQFFPSNIEWKNNNSVYI